MLIRNKNQIRFLSASNNRIKSNSSDFLYFRFWLHVTQLSVNPWVYLPTAKFSSIDIFRWECCVLNWFIYNEKYLEGLPRLHQLFLKGWNPFMSRLKSNFALLPKFIVLFYDFFLSFIKSQAIKFFIEKCLHNSYETPSEKGLKFQ